MLLINYNHKSPIFQSWNDYLLGDRLCKCVTHSDVNFWPRTQRVWVRVSCRPPKLKAAILVLVVRFCESIKSCERYEFYCCGDVQVTTAQPARSENCYKSKSRSGIVLTHVYQTWLVAFFLGSWLKNLMVFLSLSLLLESKVSLRQPVSVLYCFMYTSWRCSCL